MIFFIIVLGLLCLWKIKYEQRGDYLNVYRTNSIKGIFIILIFFSHITNDYVSFGGELAVPYYMLKKILGQCVVCLFLFYSGYAMLHKLTTEEDYCKNIPTRRILTTLLRFDAAIVLFALYGMYKGTKYSIKRMVLTFLGWNGIGNSNWYIFCILCLYLFTYIAFTVFSNKKKAVTAVTLLTIIYMGIVNKYQGSWWWDTALCYSLGMWFYIYKEKIHEIIDENFKTWITSFFISLANTSTIDLPQPFSCCCLYISFPIPQYNLISALLTAFIASY